jgi:SAM-dependent methyltransferase
VLELGSGGGNNAVHLAEEFELTLTDLSSDMLEVSQQLNPRCRHLHGDMRTLRLGELFDAVLLHDAVEYMTSEDDLRRAMVTAYLHCRPGGVVVLVPDNVAETFQPGTGKGGNDAPDGRGARYLEWTVDPDPADTTVRTDYVLVLRDADGSVDVVHDVHVTGLFPEADWLRLLTEVGFVPEAVTEETDEDRPPRRCFVAHKPT